MNLLRPGSTLLLISLLAALTAPAAAEQVFSTVSTGPVHTYPTAGPYPIGDIYYSPCGWYGNHGGSYGGGSGFGHGSHRGLGNTTLTGERFYPFDISSNGNRIHSGSGNRNHGNGFGSAGGGYGMNCGGSGYGGRNPSPPMRGPIPMPYATPKA
jgi:hypothetical protein